MDPCIISVLIALESAGVPLLGETILVVAYHRVDIGLGIGPAKPFRNDPDSQAAGVSGELLGIRFRAQSRRLTRVEAIEPGEHLERLGGVAGGTGNGPGMIKCQFNGEDASVWHKPLGRLVADRSAPTGGNSDRPSLVTTDGHVALAGDDSAALPVEEPPADRFGSCGLSKGPVSLVSHVAELRATYAQ